jgi:integral membrane protein
MLKSLLGWFRLISFAEGLSWLLLLLIAMPLKYLGGYLAPTRFVGMAHGLLFVLYLLLWKITAMEEGWSWRRRLQFFVAAIIPGGALWVERVLSREQRLRAPSPAKP